MTTKYDIGDVVMVPATVEKVTINHKGRVYYDMVNVVNNSLTGLSNVLEENIIGPIAAYDKRKCQKIPLGLLDKRTDLIKQLREANRFTYDEISMIMNMDEDIVRTILSDNES